jgi:hypothetical protein
MTLIKTEDAAGQVLCHDITQIIPGTYKGARFHKGHIITPEDIPVLLAIGKEHLYIWEKKEGALHEEEAAEILCALCRGPFIERGPVREGKIELFAGADGLFKVNSPGILGVNSLEGVIIAAKAGNQRVRKGDKLAGVKVVPLVIEEEVMEKAKARCAEHGGGPLLKVVPFARKRVGLVITGSEVYHKRVKDGFEPVLREKLGQYDAEFAPTVVLDDDHAKITEQCLSLLEDRCGLVICTGGMLLLAYYQKDTRKIPIAGLPACVMYMGRTLFDLLLPRLMADDEITRADLAAMGEGGLL